MKKIHLWLLALASGLLLAAAWPVNGLTPLIFFALVPLFGAEDFVLRKQKEYDAAKAQGKTGVKHTRYHVFGYSYLSFAVWNALTTWWIWFSTPAAVLAIGLNALLMAFTFTCFHYTCRHFFKKGSRWIILFVYWIGFEYFHHNWDVSWPWLTLGNVFSTRPEWVQWYEITGALGGSLWILICNAAILRWIGFRKAFLNGLASQKSVFNASMLAAGLIFLPFLASVIRYYTYRPQGKPVEVVVVQPNLDPYSDQFDLTPRDAARRMLQLVQSQVSEQTRFIVTPESMLQENVWEDEMPYCTSVRMVQHFLKTRPNAQLVAGISSYSRVPPSDSAMQGVRKFRYTDNPFLKYYRAHNSVIVISADAMMPMPIHHKSKLTPGVEIMPFAGKLKFVEKLAIDLGGTTGTLGVDPGPTVFISDNPLCCRVEGGSYAEHRRAFKPADTLQRIKFSDIICYESVFGDYVASCVRAGAELLFVSTNDGWWGNTPGHRQHASYARLRAIENRRDIARSANTGISCFIDQKGKVYQATPYWEPACIKRQLSANRALSPYARYGDVLGRCALPLSLFFLLLTLVYRFFPQAWRNRVKLIRTPSPTPERRD